ncbi:MAG: double zinc ribbon domain-containing protein, partial [Candidatus Omnitrophota bacterium]
MFKTHLKAFRNLLFPNLCFYCENKILDGYLCKRCREKITLLKNPLCYGCSRPLSYKQSSFCGQCQKVKPVCDRIISACAYKEPLAQLLQLFKYKHYDYLADFFASLLRDQIMASGINIQEYDTMMPVPCHPDTKKIRGYNQSFLLAKLL